MMRLSFTEPDEDDIPFILSSWLRSYRWSAPGAWVRDDYQYFAWQEALAKELIRRCDVIVARPDEDTPYLTGWICGDKTDDGKAVVHYVYVKHTFRRAGVGRSLVERLVDQVGGTSPGWITHLRRPQIWWMLRDGWKFQTKALKPMWEGDYANQA